MRKRLCLFVLLLAALLLLSACHGSRKVGSFEVPQSLDTSRDYEIVFWAKNDTNKTQTEIYQKAIDDFQALYPNIHVNMRLYTDYGKIYNDVITNISTNINRIVAPRSSASANSDFSSIIYRSSISYSDTTSSIIYNSKATYCYGIRGITLEKITTTITLS